MIKIFNWVIVSIHELEFIKKYDKAEVEKLYLKESFEKLKKIELNYKNLIKDNEQLKKEIEELKKLKLCLCEDDYTK